MTSTSMKGEVRNPAALPKPLDSIIAQVDRLAQNANDLSNTEANIALSHAFDYLLEARQHMRQYSKPVREGGE